MKRYFLSVLILLVLVLGVAYLATNIKVTGLSGLQVAQTSPPNDGCEDTLQTVAAANNINPNDVIMITGVQVGLPVTPSFDVNGTPVVYNQIEFSISQVPNGPQQDFPFDQNELISSENLSNMVEGRILTDNLSAGSIYSWKAKGMADSVWSGYSDLARYFFVCP